MIRYDEVRRIGDIAPTSIRAVLDFVIPRLNDPMPKMDGFGICTVAGGGYLKYLWAQVRKVRELTDAPIQCYHIGPGEIIHPAVSMLRDMGVEFVDALPLMREQNYRSKHGWCAKSIAAMYCTFKVMCFMDADCFPLMKPEEILTHPDFSEGFLDFPDIAPCRKGDMCFPQLGIKRPEAYVEAEEGQFLVDRSRWWKEIQLYSFMNGRPKPFHSLTHGDKTLMQFSAMKLGRKFQMAGTPEWIGYGIRHKLTDGTPVFSHEMNGKRSGSHSPEVEELFREFELISKPIAAYAVN